MKRCVFFALPVCVLLALGVAACGGTTTSEGNHTIMAGTPGSDPMTESLKELSGKDFEVSFMQEMIVHHQAAVTMARLIPTHTKRTELNILAHNIISAQSKEISEMGTWLLTWYNKKPLADSMSTQGMMTMMGDMKQLEKARGTAFDKLFLTMMIMHHQQAVNMVHLFPQKTKRPELIKLGQNIASSQSAEIQQMQAWQQEW